MTLLNENVIILGYELKRCQVLFFFSPLVSSDCTKWKTNKQTNKTSKTNLLSRECANSEDFFKVSNKIKEFELSI